MSEWDACLVEKTGLEPGREGRLTFLPGADAELLYLRAEWDRSLFVSEYSHASLLVALPASVGAGKTVPIAASDLGQYQEGGQIETYRSTALVGTIEILELDDSEATVRIALQATSPDVDLESQGDKTLEAELALERTTATHDCF